MEDFLAALKSPEWKAEIPPNKRDILLTRAKESRVEAVTFQDFVNVVSGCMRISIKLSRKVYLCTACVYAHTYVSDDFLLYQKKEPTSRVSPLNSTVIAYTYRKEETPI